MTDPHDHPPAANAPVTGPHGTMLRMTKRAGTLDNLPPPDTKRWVMRRKAQVVQGVRAGLLSVEEALRRYGISEEEFTSWQRLIDRHGMRALRATRLQDYRADQEAAKRG